MKNNHTCPKCHSVKIIRIPGSGGQEAPQNNMIKLGFFDTVYVSRFVCASCGYSEEWIEYEQYLHKLKETFGILQD